MKEVTIICDPIGTRASVQYSLVSMVIKCFKDYDTVRVVSPYIPHNHAERLMNEGATKIQSLAHEIGFFGRIMYKLEGNESMLWGVSWMFEAMFQTNSSLFYKVFRQQEKTVVLNMSYTVPVHSTIFWNLATPPGETLRVMGATNLPAKILHFFLNLGISALDRKLRANIINRAEIFLNSSNYLQELYTSLGVKGSGILHIPRIFSSIEEPSENPQRDYVLAYIGKEVELDTVLKIAKRGVRIKAFGAKIPYGTSLTEIRKHIEFLGYVSEHELSVLYHNALYTVFPFTEEPFGFVPIESMHFGTPVLSFNRQGPSETILDGKTGWLVNTKEELIEKAVNIWEKGQTGIDEIDCTERAAFFSLDKFETEIHMILGGLI